MKLLIYIGIIFTSVTYGQSYSGAESVDYDSANDRWIVSNGSRVITDDGNGNLNYLGTGSLSHGLDIIGNNAVGISNNTLKAYDLTTGTETMSFPIPNASFCNGLTHNGNIVYVTDFSANKIYSIDITNMNAPIFQIIVSNTNGTPNGIIFDENNNRLVFVEWGGSAKIKAVNLTNFSITTLITTSLGNIDGIIMDSRGNFIVASWSPDRITSYNNDFSQSQTVSLTSSINNPADIGYDASNDIIAIPVGNDVKFESLSTLSTPTFEKHIFKISENPINNNSFITISQLDGKNVTLSLYDVLGKEVKQLYKTTNFTETEKIYLNNLNLQKGIYILNLTTNNSSYTKKIIVD